MIVTAVAKNILMSIETSVNVEIVIATQKQKTFPLKIMEWWSMTQENAKAANNE